MNELILTGKKIILAEDDSFLASVITQKLEMHGAIVSHFTNGETCLQAIEESIPDLLLLDIYMPGLSGYQILDTLANKKILPELPVIVISNSGQPIEINKIQKLGIRDYIIKANFEPDEVIHKIMVALDINSNKSPKEIPMAIYETLTPVFENVEVVRVLVVEDDPLLRNMLSVKLANSHCPHMFSNDGLQALELAVQFEPQVIVLDLMLPGKDGFEVLAELKADDRVKATPVIIFSNKSGDNERSRAMELGASAYRVKAMTDLNELIGELRRLAKVTL